MFQIQGFVYRGGVFDENSHSIRTSPRLAARLVDCWIRILGSRVPSPVSQVAALAIDFYHRPCWLLFKLEKQALQVAVSATGQSGLYNSVLYNWVFGNQSLVFVLSQT